MVIREGAMPPDEILQWLDRCEVCFLVQDRSPEAFMARLREFTEALKRLPRTAVALSFKYWLGRGTHMPSPGNIAAEAE